VRRYIYVCHAPVARTWCTMPRVLKCVAWISIMASLHQSTRFVDRTYEPIKISWRGQDSVVVCKVSDARVVGRAYWIGGTRIRSFVTGNDTNSNSSTKIANFLFDFNSKTCVYKLRKKRRVTPFGNTDNISGEKNEKSRTKIKTKYIYTWKRHGRRRVNVRF